MFSDSIFILRDKSTVGESEKNYEMTIITPSNSVQR